jgi:NAD(P)-dependent dehydrogenase (short-subunit alcohol dehydrogenase family)
MGALDGKVAIVTGAGQGLGRAHAITLAAEGASVIVNDVDGDLARTVADEIVAAGGAAETNTDSVSDWAATEALVARTVELFGDLHIVVNNAGIIRDRMSFSMSEAEWDAVTNVHLKGHFCLSRHAGVWWRDQAKAGSTTPRRIINTTSEAGMFGSAGQANYASAKAGIVSLTWVFARELGRYGVTANVIAPRARTQMTEAMGFLARPQDGSFDRWDPANVSRIVAWLASDGSASINGQIFVVFGGDVHHIEPFRAGASVTSDHPWTVEELLAAQTKLVGDGPTAPPDPGIVGA